MSASINVVSQFSQSAINSIALEAAVAAAREALKGETPNAWAAASQVANACNLLAASGSAKAAIFTIAAKQASDGFAAARIAAGALEADSKWQAFASAASVCRGALEYGIWVVDIAKSAAQKAVKASREAADSAAYAAAVAAGIVPAQSSPESEAAALRSELFIIKSDYDLKCSALKSAQERLIPIDALNKVHSEALAALQARLDQALAVAADYRAQLAARLSENDELAAQVQALQAAAKPAKRTAKA